MNFKIYYCTHKGINFLQIISEEVINRKLEAEKVEQSDFVKYLQKDNPKGFNDFLAVLYNSEIHHNIDFKSLSYDGLQKEEVSKLNSYLRNLTFDKVNFMNSNHYYPKVTF